MRLMEAEYQGRKRRDPSFNLLGFRDILSAVRVKVMQVLGERPRFAATLKERVAQLAPP